MNKMWGVMGLVVGLSAAGRDPIPEWEEQSDYTLSLGYGWDIYTSYDDLGELQLQRGFQGGQHLNASVRAHEDQVGQINNLTCTTWLVDKSKSEDDNVVIEPYTEECEFMTVQDMFYDEVPEDVAPGTLFLPWLQLYVESPNVVLGKELELRVEIASPDGQIGRAWFNGPVTWMPEGDGVDLN